MSELISLVRPPEPLSGAAKEILQSPDDRLADLSGFIRTSRARRIGYELARYCLREQEGCSLLIAGGRGAGKTTLIRLVVQELIIHWRRGTILKSARSSTHAARPLIPLPIILHGPTLLDIYERSDWRVEPPDDVPAALAEKFVNSRRRAALKERALRTTITALYTHLRDAMIEAWDNAVRTRHGGATRELAELRAHLDLLLDTAPEPAPLRRIWQRAGFLEAGVLPALYPSFVEYPAVQDQAVRELHALSACAQSFLSILGKIKETQTKGLKDTDETSVSMGAATTPHEAEKKPAGNGSGEGRSLTVVIPAVAASIGVIAHNVATQVPPEGATSHLVASAGAGFATLLVAHLSLYVSKLALRVERSRRRSSYHDHALSVDVDWSAQRLERELPKLLALVKAAGLAPVFVIDELDKLEEPFDELHDFLHLTKHIVRDQAAFLFLSNRDYFERIMETGADLTIGGREVPAPTAPPAPQPDAPSGPPAADSQTRAREIPLSPAARYRLKMKDAEKSSAEKAKRDEERRQKATARTFYEHMLSLFYEPADFRHYFETLYRKATQRRGVVTQSEGDQKSEQRTSNEALDVLALGTILAFRSRLSPFRFNQRLNALLDDDGRLQYGDGEPFFDGMMLQHLRLQIVAETIARKANISARVESRPRDAQMLYDALYYVAEQIEFSPPAPAAFEVVIRLQDLRMYLLRKASSDRDPEQVKDVLEPDTLNWLFDQMHQQILALDDPDEFFKDLPYPERALQPEARSRHTDLSDSPHETAAWYSDPGKLRSLARQALSGAKPIVGAVSDTTEEIRFELLVDGFASERKPKQPQAAETPRAELVRQVADLRAWQSALEALFGDPAQAHAAASRIGALPEAVRWTPVRDALERARQLLERPDAEPDMMRDLTRDLGSYLEAIDSHRVPFDQCVRAASVVALPLDGATLTARRGEALELMASILPSDRDPATLERTLRMPANERRDWSRSPIGKLLQRPANLERLPMADWCASLGDIAKETNAAKSKVDRRFWQQLDTRYWSQWAWNSRGTRVTRSRPTNLLDLVFAARHSRLRFLESGNLNARLDLWSLLLFRSLQGDEAMPAAIQTRVRRDLGLDRAPGEPVLIVASDESGTLSWPVSGKVPALAVHFTPAPKGPPLPVAGMDTIVRALSIVAGETDSDGSPDDRPHRPWMLAIDATKNVPVDASRLFETLGDPGFHVFFSTDRTDRPELRRPFLPDAKSLEDLYRFALDHREPSRAP